MSVVAQYTIDHIKRNRRSSIAVMVAILLASALLCSFCIAFQGIWVMLRDGTIEAYGNWHGELFTEMPGENLQYVEGNPAVESVMIKGDWQAVKLPEGLALPYLFLRDTNAAYWKDMGEKTALMEGRLPERTGEIAVSRLFFDRNPGCKVGDTLTLPVGDRMLEGQPMEVVNLQRDGESFRQTGERTLTIVGKLDLTTSTASPGYYAMGFMDRGNILPDDGLTIYLRFYDIYDTFKVLPQIAQSVGMPTDAYGEYSLRYNGSLLSLYGISYDGLGFSDQIKQQVGLATVILLLAMGAFVAIINSVFSLSAEARVKQLGMFRSVGATPKQIRRSILLEGLLLAIPPVLLSAILGFGFYCLMVDIYNRAAARIGDFPILQPEFLPYAALLGMALSIATVLLSASIPARRMAKLTPIEAVQGGKKRKLKQRRERKHPLAARLFGFNGTLALDTLAAHKKSFRSPVAALCLGFVLMGGMLVMVNGFNLNNQMGILHEKFDVSARITTYQKRDDAMLEQARKLPEASESVMYSKTNVGLMVDESWQSEAFTERGGFSWTNEQGYHTAAPMDGGYRQSADLIGLADDSFAAYCRTLGIDAQPYLDAEAPKAIVVNAMLKDPDEYMKNYKYGTAPETADLLRLSTGQTLTLLEKYNDQIESDHSFAVDIGALTLTPPETSASFPFYRPIFVLPIEQYDRIVEDFLPERATSYRGVMLDLITGEENSLAAENSLKATLDRYMGEEDYSVKSKQGRLNKNMKMWEVIRAVGAFISLLIALIGVSNAFSSVAGNLAMRRREFAMLRSVGLDGKGLGNMLFMEGLFFALRPILIGLPLLLLVCQIFLSTFDLSWLVFLPVMPVLPIALYALAVLATLGLAYWNGARQIRRNTIVDALRDEAI